MSAEIVSALDRILEAARVRHSMNSHAWFPSFAEEVAADIRTAQRLRDAIAKGPSAWRGCNANPNEVVTEWIDGAPPEAFIDLCGNPSGGFDIIEFVYALPTKEPK